MRIMPELPEIETIKHIVEPQIRGLTIENVLVNRPEVIAHPTADEFCKDVTGQAIGSMARRGKFLIIHLGNQNKIILHLRMTGCLLVTPADYQLEKHTHIVMQLSSGMELRFSDTRRFGRFWLIRKDEKDTYSGIEKLGLEPLSAECNAEYLQSRLQNTPFLQVYGHADEPCPNCGNTLCRTVIGGRSSVYCPACQNMKNNTS